MLLLATLLASQALAIEPAPKTFVQDRANILDRNSETKLIAMLQELEQKTSARVIVLTVSTTKGQDIQQYAFERADKWKTGPNKASASVLIVVAKKDRKYSIQVGYNWEGVLPDGLVGQIGRQHFVPHFRNGDYQRGLIEGTAVIAQTIAKSTGKTLSGMPNIQYPGRGGAYRSRGGVPCCAAPIMPILLVLAFVFGGRRTRSLMFWGLLAGTMMGGGRRGGGFGGGGGSFGGFGGGGGGGFGGGGASGSW